MKKNKYICVCFVLFQILFNLQATEYIVISEIMYDSPLNEVITQTPYSNGEYVELYNAGNQTVDLTDWELWGGGTTEKYTFSNVSIAPQAYLIAAYRHNNSATFMLDSLYAGLTPTVNDGVVYQNKIILSNTKEYIRLKDVNGLLRDSIYYGNVTSIQPISARLVATNENGISGFECVSVHQVNPVFDENGCVIPDYLHWEVGTVTPFGLPETFRVPEVSSIDFSGMSTQNYIITSVPTVEKTNSLPGSENELTTIQYFDGLGRPVQTVQMAITPQKNDLVTFQEYDDFGRESNAWLPRVAESNNGAFVSFDDFGNLPKTEYQNDAKPYSKTIYEPSPLNRVTDQYGTGAAWHNNNKRTTTSYGANDGSIAYFYVNETGNLQRGSNYAPATLYKTTVADEDGKTVSEFKDKLDRVVMVRKAGDVDTYYVYNDLNQLSYVLPPLAADALKTASTASAISENNDNLKKYAYVYKYDERGNPIYKRLPGCEPVYMVYDQTDRLIFSQDGNQRLKNEWSFFFYDVFGRVAFSGIMSDVNISFSDDWGSPDGYYDDYLSSDNIVECLKNKEFYLEAEFVDQNATPGPFDGYKLNIKGEFVGNSPSGNLFVELSGFHILQVNYYDNYDFLSLFPDLDETALGYQELTDYGIQYTSAKSLPTGTRTYLLDDSGSYIATATYYDYRGRVIQTRSTNHLGGYDFVYNAYDFTGNVTRSQTEHSIANQSPVTALYEYAYDHALRPTTTTYTLNNSTPVVLASNTYDELGRLVEKKRHDNTDTEEFEYNIRNWTMKITSGEFEENLYYNTPMPDNPTFSACYNGNIAASSWKYNGAINGYTYDYDNLNRLSSTYSVLNDQWADALYTETFRYDKHGNIKYLFRWDNQDISDDLTLTYDGNQLKKVADRGISQNLYSIKEYRNLADLATEFYYDANGNMTSDLDRDIVTIKYNLLNLPEEITFSNGMQIRNSYAADGRKLETYNITSISSTTLPVTITGSGGYTETVQVPFNVTQGYGTQYVGNMEYSFNRTIRENRGGMDEGRGEISEQISLNELRIHNTEGYVDFEAPDDSEFWFEPRYNYYRQDHLGNVREVWRAPHAVRDYSNNLLYQYTASTVQKTQYYPSGLPWKSNTGDHPEEQRHKYGGKEFVEEHGLDEYDSQARWYYPVIMRTTTVDPLAEKYYDVSPYVWCGNNPVKFIDPDGLRPVWNGKYGDESEYIDTETNKEVSWEQVQNYMKYGDYSGQVELENSNDKSSHTITPFGVGVEWLTGKGERNRTFVDGDYFTELLKKHEFLAEYKKVIAKLISMGITDSRKVKGGNYTLNGVQGVGKYIEDYSTLLTGGLTGNLAVTYLGSYHLDWSVIQSTGNKVLVLFEVNNSSTIQSGTRPPVIGYTPIWQNTIGKSLNDMFSNGAMSKTTQKFVWTEEIILQ